MTATCELIHNFSKGAKNYDREAYVQNVCAKRFGLFLRKQKDLIVEGEILEIGCGTGFISKELIQTFPGRKVMITDICPRMLEKCQENLGVNHVNFSLLDGERFSDINHYSLIISGLAFQWFQCFQKSVISLIHGLKKGGLLLFSFVESKSFPEWQFMCQDLGLSFTGNHFPCLEDIRSITGAVPSASHIWEEELTLIYPNALQCLKSFKRIGAGTSLKKKQLSPNQMRHLLGAWDSQCPNGVAMTYNIANVAIQRF